MKAAACGTRRTNGEIPVPPAPTLDVSIGHNASIHQVVMFFDDPTAPDAKYVTFTAAQARGIGHALVAEADKAEGTGPV